MTAIAISPPARASYIALYHIARRSFILTARRQDPSSHFHRSDFANQPFTGSYEPGQPTVGPLGDVPILGPPSLTPKILKQHLDQFVVGQERAKKVMSVAVFNHYQRVLELQRREEEEQQLLQQRLRRERHSPHPVEGWLVSCGISRATVNILLQMNSQGKRKLYLYIRQPRILALLL